MDEAWIDAARLYNSLDDGRRAHYWSQLTAEQQTLLTGALTSLAEASKATTAVTRAPRPGRSLIGTLSIGCIGMIVGCILTIALEILAVSQGIQAVSGLLQSPSAAGPSEASPSSTLRDEDFSRIDCGTLLKTDPGLYSQCMSRQHAEEEMIKRNLRINAGEDPN